MSSLLYQRLYLQQRNSRISRTKKRRPRKKRNDGTAIAARLLRMRSAPRRGDCRQAQRTHICKRFCNPPIGTAPQRCPHASPPVQQCTSPSHPLQHPIKTRPFSHFFHSPNFVNATLSHVSDHRSSSLSTSTLPAQYLCYGPETNT